jgi:MFS family permease
MSAAPTTAPRARTHRRPASPRRHATGFWLVAATLLTLTTAAGAPSPLFVLYQQRLGFAPVTLTAVFAVYALALLVALLVAGSLSDHVGRRPVLVAALLLVAVAMGLFWRADSVAGLVLARVVQGLGTGVALGVVSAALIDLEPERRRGFGRLMPSAVVNSVAATLGLGLGAVASGLLVDAVADPTAVVFGALTALLLVLAVLVAVVPETVTPRAGALGSLVPRVSLPPATRPVFVAAAPVLVATWAIGGLYLSLGPTLAVQVLDLHRHVAGGLVVAALTTSGAVAVLVLRTRTAREVMTGGTVLLAVGTVVTLTALDARSVPGFFVGTVVAGAGFGSGFSGALRTIAATVQEHQRAEVFAAVYVASYLAFSVPAVAAGAAARPVGLLATTNVYGVLVLLAALLALGLTWRARSTDRRAAPAPEEARPSAPGCPQST